MSDSSDVNPNTGLPHTLSLAEVFDQIRLAPHEIASLLGTMASWYQGTAQGELTGKFNDAAAAVLNPKSHGLSGESQQPAPVQQQPVAGPRPTPFFSRSGITTVDSPRDQPDDSSWIQSPADPRSQPPELQPNREFDRTSTVETQASDATRPDANR